MYRSCASSSASCYCCRDINVACNGTEISCTGSNCSRIELGLLAYLIENRTRTPVVVVVVGTSTVVVPAYSIVSIVKKNMLFRLTPYIPGY